MRVENDGGGNADCFVALVAIVMNVAPADLPPDNIRKFPRRALRR